MQMEEGHVLTCMVTECSYNQNEVCFAPQIDVGDMHPTCDTFTKAQAQPVTQGMPDVATCNVTECKFNQSKDCMAPGITVSNHSGHADCFTYRSEG